MRRAAPEPMLALSFGTRSGMRLETSFVPGLALAGQSVPFTVAAIVVRNVCDLQITFAFRRAQDVNVDKGCWGTHQSLESGGRSSNLPCSPPVLTQGAYLPACSHGRKANRTLCSAWGAAVACGLSRMRCGDFGRVSPARFLFSVCPRRFRMLCFVVVRRVICAMHRVALRSGARDVHFRNQRTHFA